MYVRMYVCVCMCMCMCMCVLEFEILGVQRPLAISMRFVPIAELSSSFLPTCSVCMEVRSDSSIAQSMEIMQVHVVGFEVMSSLCVSEDLRTQEEKQ